MAAGTPAQMAVCQPAEAFRRSGDGDFSFGASTLAQAQPWPLVLLQLVAAASATEAAEADGGGPAGADGCGPVEAQMAVCPPAEAAAVTVHLVGVQEEW